MDQLVQLKAQAYDIMANLQFFQGELQKVNQQITKVSEQLNISQPNVNEPKNV